MTKEQKAAMARAALAKSVLPMRDPVVDGLTCNADVPFPIHHELMEAAIDKAISLSWLCAIYRAGVIAGRNISREPREPHAALLTEIEGVIAEDGFSGGPDKRKSTGKLEAWCPECSSYREEGHDEDCRWLRDHKLLRRCKAAILGSPTEGEQG